MLSRIRYKKSVTVCTVAIEARLKVLPTEKILVVLFWTFIKFLGNQEELEKVETTKNFC